MKNKLKSFFTEHWRYLAVNAACKLKLFDKIKAGQNTIEILCEKNQWNKPTLLKLVNFLTQDEFLETVDNTTFSLNTKGDLLRESNPCGLHHACLNWAEEHLTAWQNLDFTIKTGKSSFEHLYQKPFFDYLNDHPEKLDNYHKAMFEYAIDDYKELPNIIDFGIHKSIMDVGAGYGAAIGLIKNKNPELECILFDLENVSKRIKCKEFQKVSGDFFEHIPKLADAIILSRVIHDWDDEKASIILENCKESLPENGSLYIIENCSDKIPGELDLLSLNMTALCKSFERSSNDFIELAEKSGFKFQSDKRLNQLQTILIFKK